MRLRTRVCEQSRAPTCALAPEPRALRRGPRGPRPARGRRRPARRHRAPRRRLGGARARRGAPRSARLRTRGWLVLAVGAFVLPVVVFAAAGVDLHGGLGERALPPARAESAARGYELGAGKLEVDLRGVRLPAGADPAARAPRARRARRDRAEERVRAHPCATRRRLCRRARRRIEGPRRRLARHPAPRRRACACCALEGHVGLGALFVVEPSPRWPLPGERLRRRTKPVTAPKGRSQ